MIARMYYDEPTCTGWVIGMRRCHVEVNRFGVSIQLGTLSFRLHRDSAETPSEWEGRR